MTKPSPKTCDCILNGQVQKIQIPLQPPTALHQTIRPLIVVSSPARTMSSPKVAIIIYSMYGHIAKREDPVLSRSCLPLITPIFQSRNPSSKALRMLAVRPPSSSMSYHISACHPLIQFFIQDCRNSLGRSASQNACTP